MLKKMLSGAHADWELENLRWENVEVRAAMMFDEMLEWGLHEQAARSSRKPLATGRLALRERLAGGRAWWTRG